MPTEREYQPALFQLQLTEAEVGFLAGLVQPRIVHSTTFGRVLAQGIYEKLERAADRVVANREKSITGRVRKVVAAAPAPEAAGGKSMVPAGAATSASSGEKEP